MDEIRTESCVVGEERIQPKTVSEWRRQTWIHSGGSIAPLHPAILARFAQAEVVARAAKGP